MSSKDLAIIRGVQKSLEGLKDVVENLPDTGEITELSLKIGKAIEVSHWITDEGILEEEFRAL